MKRLISSRAKTRGSKKTYVLTIYEYPIFTPIKQHFYHEKRDAHKDMSFLVEMLGDCIAFKLEQAEIPNPLWVKGENNMLEDQMRDLPNAKQKESTTL